MGADMKNKLYKAAMRRMLEDDEDEDELDDLEWDLVRKAIEVLGQGNTLTLADGTEASLAMQKSIIVADAKINLGDAKAEIVEAFYTLLESEADSAPLRKSFDNQEFTLNTRMGVKDSHLIVQTEDGRFWEIPYTTTDDSVEFAPPIELEATFKRCDVKKKPKMAQ